MKLLLVVPRYNLLDKVSYDYAFPIGLGYISAAIKNAGYDIQCLNLNHFAGTINSLMENCLKKENYDVIITGHMAMGYAVIEKIINAVKKYSPSSKFVLGGALITTETELMFNSLQPDFGVLGEGDETIVELLNCLEKKGDLSKVDGICYKDETGKLVFTKPRELIKDLDSLPFPDFESFGFREYIDNQSNAANFNILDYPRPYTILCSRGCPYQCTFCYHSIGLKYRIRSMNNIFQEIETAIKKYNINCLEILDDLFSINEERLYDFCKRIKSVSKKYNINLKWSCQLSVNNLSEKMLQILKESGVSVVSFGFESYSPLVLKSMKKPITPEQINNAVQLAFKSVLGLQGSFIFGDSAETKETAKETLDFWKKNCKGQIKLGFIQPYPGSEMYEKCIKKGIIKDKLDFIKNKLSHTNWFNMTDNMTDKEVIQLKKDILEARRTNYPYSVPKNIVKKANNRYELEVKCPFCNSFITYQNCLIDNRFRFNLWFPCRTCNMRFFVVNHLARIESDYYNQLDFLRRNYLILRDKILKKRI